MQYIKMIVDTKEDPDLDNNVVHVYDISHTFDSTGKITSTVVTAWVPSKRSWISGPIYHFFPITKKTLQEDV